MQKEYNLIDASRNLLWNYLGACKVQNLKQTIYYGILGRKHNWDISNKVLSRALALFVIHGGITRKKREKIICRN